MTLVELKKEMAKAKTAKQKSKLVAYYHGTKSNYEIAKMFGFEIDEVALKNEREKKHKKQKQLRVEKRVQEASVAGVKISARKYLELEAKAQKILKAYDTGYSMGDFKEMYIFNKNMQKPFLLATVDETEEYANSCKFRPTHGYLNITMSLKELELMQRNEQIWETERKMIKTEGKKQHFRLWLETK